MRIEASIGSLFCRATAQWAEWPKPFPSLPQPLGEFPQNVFENPPGEVTGPTRDAIFANSCRPCAHTRRGVCKTGSQSLAGSSRPADLAFRTAVRPYRVAVRPFNAAVGPYRMAVCLYRTAVRPYQGVVRLYRTAERSYGTAVRLFGTSVRQYRTSGCSPKPLIFDLITTISPGDNQVQLAKTQ
jgi:hypothetical protein